MTTSIAEYSATDAAIADLRTKYEAVVFDVTNAKGMGEAKKARAELREYRVSLEKCRVEIKAPALERCRQIDSEAKRITAELESLENPIDRQIKDEEQRKAREKEEAERIERERVAAINARFDAIKALPARARGLASVDVAGLIAEAEAIEPESFPADMVAAARYELRGAIAGLQAEHEVALKREADAIELERLRAAAAEVERERARLAEVERQRLADEQAAERAKADIERAKQAALDAQAAAERAAEQARIDQARAVQEAEERATREAESRDKARREQEAREAAEQAERDRIRAESLTHRKKLNNAAACAFLKAGFTDDQAKQIVTLIASGEVPHVSIRY